MSPETEAAYISDDEGDEPHGDGASDTITSRRDEHAELRREHEAHLVGAEWLSKRHGEMPRNVGGDTLERQIDQGIENVRDWIDQPKQPDRKPSRAVKSRSTEQQYSASGV